MCLYLKLAHCALLSGALAESSSIRESYTVSKVINTVQRKKGPFTCFQNRFFVRTESSKGCQPAKPYAAKVLWSLTGLLAGRLQDELRFWSQDAAASLGSIQMPFDRWREQNPRLLTFVSVSWLTTFNLATSLAWQDLDGLWTFEKPALKAVL